MTSTWGDSWGSSWGDSWGAVSAVVVGGGRTQPPRRTWQEIDEEIEQQRPLSRAQWDKLKAAQQAAEERAAELERQDKHKQAQELARIARESGRALREAEEARVESAVSLTALTTALNSAAEATRITTQLRTADRRLEAFKAYLADMEDEEDVILLLSS